MALASPPPQHVLEAFGLAGATSCLVAGGQGTTYRVGDFALKPCDRSDETEWVGSVLAAVKENGFRVARPKLSSKGRFVESGWSAFTWEPGEVNTRGRWREAIAACRSFHRALSGVPHSRLLDVRSDPYSLCDSIAWGEATREPIGDLGVDGERLLDSARPLALEAQLIHGDPSEGNLLFSDELAPAVIDFVPYWRPANYALAVLIADGIAWSRAPLSILEEVRDVPLMGALLTRAVLFRLCVAKLLRGGDEGVAERTAAYLPLIQAIDSGAVP